MIAISVASLPGDTHDIHAVLIFSGQRTEAQTGRSLRLLCARTKGLELIGECSKPAIKSAWVQPVRVFTDIHNAARHDHVKPQRLAFGN